MARRAPRAWSLRAGPGRAPLAATTASGWVRPAARGPWRPTFAPPPPYGPRARAVHSPLDAPGSTTGPALLSRPPQSVPDTPVRPRLQPPRGTHTRTDSFLRSSPAREGVSGGTPHRDPHRRGVGVGSRVKPTFRADCRTTPHLALFGGDVTPLPSLALTRDGRGGGVPTPPKQEEEEERFRVGPEEARVGFWTASRSPRRGLRIPRRPRAKVSETPVSPDLTHSSQARG